jgi:hypothetical protein
MCAPACRRIQPFRDDLRQSALISRHFVSDKVLSGRDAAISSKSTPQLGRIRLESPLSRNAFPGRQFRAISRTPSPQLDVNSKFSNILSGIQHIGIEPWIVSILISMTCNYSFPEPSPLTPYSRIFCRQVYEAKPLINYPRKIFKTNDFKFNIFNILQIIICKLLKINTYFLLFLGVIF